MVSIGGTATIEISHTCIVHVHVEIDFGIK